MPSASRMAIAACSPDRGRQSTPRIRLLQRPAIVRPDGSEVALERKTAALLVLLGIDGTIGRARAASLLWPEAAERRARANLRQLLTRLRRLAGAELILPGDPLRLALSIEVDVRALEAAAFAAPMELATFAPLLSDEHYDDCPEFAEWLSAAQTRLQRLWLTTLEANSERKESEGDLRAALVHAHQALSIDPLAERSYRRVIRLQYLLGDRPAALRTYRECERLLKEELNVEPDEETRTLARLVERGALRTTPATAPRRISPAVARPPRLVGREREWAQLEEAWGAGRTIFISGPPGIGKSRLARDFAASKGSTMVIESRPGDAAVPFASQARAVRQILAQCSGLELPAWVERQLSRLIPQLARGRRVLPPLDRENERFRFYEAQLALLRSFAQWQRATGVTPEGEATTAVIDDLQYCDSASGEIGHYMFSHRSGAAGELPIRPLLTFRSGELPPVVDQSMRQLVSAGLATRIELSPLDSAAVDALLKDLELPSIEGLEVAAGVPALLLEAIKSALQAEPNATAPRLLPRDAGQIVATRLRQLSAEALRLAQVAAVAGDRLEVALAAEVLAVDPLSIARPWRELENAQLLQDGKLVHDLVRESIHAELPNALVQHLHREIAAILERRGAGPTEIALHWQAGEEPEKADRWQVARAKGRPKRRRVTPQ